MDDLMNKIDESLNYMYANAKTHVFQHRCSVLKDRINMIKTQDMDKELLDRVCFNLIYDVERLKESPDQKKTVYIEIDNLLKYLNELKNLD